jgi:hypothetical protein
VGHCILDIADAAGDEIIDILYSDEVDKGGAPVLTGEANAKNSESAMADRYRCRAGAQRWEAFSIKGMRYVSLILRNISRPLKVRFAGVRQVGAALDEIGTFECSDARLNEIWRVGLHTLRNCMLDAYVDCPTSSQAQLWGEARVQFRANEYSFGDVSLLERGIRQVAQSQAADGSLHAHPPADASDRLPEHMLSWVGSLWDYYFHTGRTELLRFCLPALQRLFEFFATHELREGLIGGFDAFTPRPGGPDEFYRADFSATLNMMYLQALRWAAAMCHVLGEDGAAKYELKAAALEPVLERHFFDAKAKAWRDGFDPQKNAAVESISQHANALAIMLDLKSGTHGTIARDVLLKPALSRRGKVVTASPFFYAYVLEAMFEAGLRAEAVGLIKDKWGQMIDGGATTFWEQWEKPAGGQCRGAAASPLYHLSQQVLGVMPVDVGWKQVRIAPLPAKLEFARGKVPSPLGTIKVEWEKSGEDQLAVRVDVPRGMQAEFVGPLGEIRALGAGGHEFHT